MAHSGRHKCSAPGCAGFDREAVYRRIKKNGVQTLHVLDARHPMFYTIGLFANFQLPELFLQTDGPGDDVAATTTLTLLNVADYLATLPIIDDGNVHPRLRNGDPYVAVGGRRARFRAAQYGHGT